MHFKSELPLFERIHRKIQSLRLKPLNSLDLYLPYVTEKKGLEIGGPSGIFKKRNPLPIYEKISELDNCDFSKSTVWAKHDDNFIFNSKKNPGKTYFSEGSVLADVSNAVYDFLLSSHNLEHFANPVKALKEWQRVLKPNGALILVLPDYRKTFDHYRHITSVDHMMDDFNQNIGEDDLTHLPEILEKHDLMLDKEAGSKENFYNRSLKNFTNRCLHHHIFDENNSRELLLRTGFEVLAVELAPPIHICLLARVK